jgi:hypothetical protein
MKEQIKKVEKAMEKRLTEQSERLRRLASKPPTIREEGETSGTREDRFSRWASQILPELPKLPPSPVAPCPPPLSPPNLK